MKRKRISPDITYLFCFMIQLISSGRVNLKKFWLITAQWMHIWHNILSSCDTGCILLLWLCDFLRFLTFILLFVYCIAMMREDCEYSSHCSRAHQIKSTLWAAACISWGTDIYSMRLHLASGNSMLSQLGQNKSSQDTVWPFVVDWA